ncbi:MAG: TolC family protein [Verrucomicrobiota bacterium]|jgi:outer membrane protein TolC|nr:TolC family protein [Verrucomicrobiota bacterium]
MKNGFLCGGWLVALGMAASFPAWGQSADPLPVLTLEDAIEQALAHNRDLVKGALEIQEYRLAQEQVREELRGVKIVPEGDAETGKESSIWQAGARVEATGAYGTRVGVGALARQIEVDGAPDARRGEVRAEISQPLFRRFGPLVQNEPMVSANEMLSAARRVWERERSTLVLQVVGLYESLIYWRHQVASDEAFADRMERLWALADARERQGRTTRTEVMRMDFQRGEAAIRIETGRAQLDVQFQEFANLLGLPLDSAFQLLPPPLLDLDVPEAGQALSVALSERPDYAQALQDIETGDRKLRLARRNLLPDLTVSARQSVYGEGEGWSDAGRLDQEDWFVGLSAGMNLNLRGARLDVARAGTDAEARRQVADIVRHRLAVEVNGALAAVRRTRAELQLAERNSELAERRSTLARALFEAGRAGADQVSDAEADASQAVLNELAARREASVAAYRLLHVLGTLVPVSEDLVANNEVVE